MEDQVRGRLRELRQEFQTGQVRLRELELQEAALRETLLRISGAMQVLEEMLPQPAEAEQDGAQPAAPQAVPSASA